MKKQYINPEITVTRYVDVIVMSGNSPFDSDNIGNLSDWVTPSNV